MINPTMSFSDYRAAGGLNYSAIKAGQKSMLAMRHELTRERDAGTAAQQMGTLIHLAVLTPELFADSVVIWTGYENTKGAWTFDRRSKVWEEFEADNAGKTILTPGELQVLESVKLAALANPEIRRVMESAEMTEASVFWDASMYGAAKCRPDIIGKYGTVWDLKTCADISRFERDAIRYGYHLQAGWYLEGCRQNGISNYMRPWGWIVVEYAPPYDCGLFFAGMDAIDFGRRECVRIASEFRECERNGVYPGAYPEPVTVGLPVWMQDNLADMAQNNIGE
jgi:hypothetical protein